MIRINLLPQKRESRQEGGQAWLLVLLAAVFLEVVAIIFIHNAKTKELKTQVRKNDELTSQIGEINKTVSKHGKVKAELAVYKNREQAIASLEGGRTGPTEVLIELSRVLTPGRGPTVDPDRLAQLRKDNPLAVPNPSWDTKRLWVLSLIEANRVVTIEGMAEDGEDVSEFARRLALSNYFQDVKLLPAAKVRTAGEAGEEMVKFQLQTKVKY